LTVQDQVPLSNFAQELVSADPYANQQDDYYDEEAQPEDYDDEHEEKKEPMPANPRDVFE